MNKDAGLKDRLLRHYWKQRYFAQPEVDVYFHSGSSDERKLVTDIDVFALRPHPDLYFERILGDCKTLKGQSPISRAMWLAGTMKFLGANSGCVLLDMKNIEPDHKLAAAELSVMLLNSEDFEVYDCAINHPGGSDKTPIAMADLDVLKGLWRRFPRLQSACEFFYRDAWFEKDFGNLIRRSCGYLRTLSTEVDPKHPEHLALVADAAAVMSIGIAECSGRLFRRYLHPKDKETLSDSLKVTIWGGRSQYEFLQNLRNRLFEKNKDEVQPLELPEWSIFVQLIRHNLDRPTAAFDLPWILRQAALDMLAGTDFLSAFTGPSDLFALKSAMLTLEYVCKAGKFPREVQERVVAPFISLQSNFASQNTVSVKAVSFHETLNRHLAEQVKTDCVPKSKTLSSSDKTDQITLFEKIEKKP